MSEQFGNINKDFLNNANKDCEKLQSQIDKRRTSNKISTIEIVLYSVFSTIVLFFLAMIILFSTVYYFVKVDGDSMNNTLHNGQALIVRNTNEFERGDIVIIDKNGTLVVKRVIATGGDKLEISDGAIRLTKKGEQGSIALNEKYVKDGVSISREEEIRLTLKDDEVFYLGDNRLDSKDSTEDGPCKKSQIIGVVTDFSLNNQGLTKFLMNLFSWSLF